ncbi:response regulator [Phenylobacterium sp.]|jgi:CheY-like chemotaxis protein|uniref:response regulator n=1 Tax=Phenylobacterium sp. TaxID=1871053 RepID=UPI002F3EC241
MRFDLLSVLLVDDNVHMRTLLANVLSAVGVRQIHQAIDGMDGLALLSRHSVNLVITDLSMQPLNGIDFVTLLRRSPGLR